MIMPEIKKVSFSSTEFIALGGLEGGEESGEAGGDI